MSISVRESYIPKGFSPSEHTSLNRNSPHANKTASDEPLLDTAPESLRIHQGELEARRNIYWEDVPPRDSEITLIDNMGQTAPKTREVKIVAQTRHEATSLPGIRRIARISAKGLIAPNPRT